MQSYAALRQRFRWDIPDLYNIALDTVDRHAAERANALALIVEEEDGSTATWSFGALSQASRQLANAFAAGGLAAGDRVAVLLGQSSETAIAHLAIYRSGLIAVPMFVLFGPDAIEYRLSDSGAAALVTDLDNWPKVAEIRDRLPELRTIFVVDGRGIDGTLDFEHQLSSASSRFRSVRTRADDPAIIIYTSGTTGPPKGALHAHRFLLGHLPGVLLPHDFPPKSGDLFWTPADWAWIGGLYDVLFPAWHWGLPVVAHRARRFDPDRALDLMARHQIRNVFLPPTALKLIRGSGTAIPPSLHLRSIGSGGEMLGIELVEWGRQHFGLTVNEFYGQTECNLIVSNSAGVMDVRPGSMGRPVPGHTVAILDDEGALLPPDAIGEIAVRRPDPVMFLGYWNQPAATASKFRGEWMLTGDRGRADSDGYIWFQARNDDVITSGAYRIGPGEIEDCLLKHPAVAIAAVVGVPDPVRTESIKAFVVLAAGVSASDSLTAELQQFVRSRLAAHEYPRAIEYVEALPLTSTGKVMRRELRSLNSARARNEQE